MKNVVILSTSLHENSNSELLARRFAEGAEAAGNKVEFISLRGKKIGFCLGCPGCQQMDECVLKDDVPAIMDAVCAADAVVWATPIYYYEMSGQMKTLIDRMNPMFPRDYRFRDVYLLTVAADEGDSVPQHAVGGINGWLDCFGRARLAGTLFCGGVNAPGAIEGNPKLDEAFEMGRNV